MHQLWSYPPWVMKSSRSFKNISPCLSCHKKRKCFLLKKDFPYISKHFSSLYASTSGHNKGKKKISLLREWNIWCSGWKLVYSGKGLCKLVADVRLEWVSLNQGALSSSLLSNPDGELKDNALFKLIIISLPVLDPWVLDSKCFMWDCRAVYIRASLCLTPANLHTPQVCFCQKRHFHSFVRNKELQWEHGK